MVMEDTASFLDFLEAPAIRRRPEDRLRRLLHGRRFALSAAGTFPDRIAAAASLHGARLATDQPDSPHLLASENARRHLRRHRGH
jgi:carboxymethylenebutenolidase